MGSCQVKDSESFHLAHARLQDGMGVEGAPPRSSIRLDVAWGLLPSPVTFLLEVLGEGGSRRCCHLFSFSLVFLLGHNFSWAVFRNPKFAKNRHLYFHGFQGGDQTAFSRQFRHKRRFRDYLLRTMTRNMMIKQNICVRMIMVSIRDPFGCVSTHRKVRASPPVVLLCKCVHIFVKS